MDSIADRAAICMGIHMRKLYYIDKLETELNMPEIEERIREIVSENQVFDIGVMSKKTHRVEVKENIISFSYLFKGRYDMLCPRMHMTVLEKEGKCTCNLFYSKTWGYLFSFLWWSFFCGICACAGALAGNVLYFICFAAVYILGIRIAKKHCSSLCKKVVTILRSQM